MTPKSIENFHETSRIEQIALSDLRIDKSYQREPSQMLVEEITRNWDEVASELVLVSDRGERGEDSGVEGGLWLVNGQHRSLAARKLGHETIWARIVDLSAEEDPAAIEAGLRLKLNVKMGDVPTERFKAQLRAGDEASLDIQKILAGFDTEINVVPNPDAGVNCVSTIEGVYNADQGALLRDTLSLLKDAYGDLNSRSCNAALIKGAAWFIEKHAGESDRGRLVDRLKITGTTALTRQAITNQSVMGGSRWMNVYRTIVDIYNNQLRDKSRLDVKLRGAGKFASRPGLLGSWQDGAHSS